MYSTFVIAPVPVGTSMHVMSTGYFPAASGQYTSTASFVPSRIATSMSRSSMSLTTSLIDSSRLSRRTRHAGLSFILYDCKVPPFDYNGNGFTFVKFNSASRKKFSNAQVGRWDTLRPPVRSRDRSLPEIAFKRRGLGMTGILHSLGIPADY